MRWIPAYAEHSDLTISSSNSVKGQDSEAYRLLNPVALAMEGVTYVNVIEVFHAEKPTFPPNFDSLGHSDNIGNLELGFSGHHCFATRCNTDKHAHRYVAYREQLDYR